MAENLHETAAGETTPAREAPDPTAGPDDRGPQADEYAAMRQAVAREYADALGKRYDPPSEDPDVREQPRFDHAEIDKHKISEYVMSPEHKLRVVNAATGLAAKDVDQIEAQIREGARNGTPVAGKSDEYGHRWHVDVPLTGPAGTMTVRTAWIVEPGGDRPRLVTISFPQGR